MLTVTPDAIDAIKAIATAGEGGLRISTIPYSRESSGSGLLLEQVEAPAASAALRWYDVVIPRNAVSALEPFDLEASLRQTAFLFAGRVTTAQGVRFG